MASTFAEAKGESAAAARSTIRALQSHYRSGDSALGRDFFAPCLTHCRSYGRAAGFFSSSVLATWARVLPRLVRESPVPIRLLISPVLSPADLAALKGAVTPALREALLQEMADRVVTDALQMAETPGDLDLRLKLFAWLVAAGRLEIRFAFARHVHEAGTFHEKIGIFEFPWGDTIAFTGSANESAFGHALNYESIDVFRSWVAEDAARVALKVAQFQEAWEGRAAGLDVRRLSEAALGLVRARAPERCPTFHIDGEGDGTPSQRWKHQDEAVAAFLEQRRGILEMATGTGKTRAALRICRALDGQDAVGCIVISADGNDLLDQWYAQVLSITRDLKRRYVVVRHYADHRERDRFILQPEGSILLVSRRALAPALRGVASELANRTLLIHDEVHRLGSPGNRTNLAGLSEGIRFRLGLSATPEREYDAEGTQFIEQHIGSVIYQFDLADAIRGRILAPFTYHPLPYEMDADDKLRIRQVYVRAAAARRAGTPMSQEEIWIELAKVHKTSRAKLPVFAGFIGQNPGLLKRCIIFVETKEYGEEVLEIVHHHRYDFHTYFAEEDSDTLQQFASGELECLLTCHRLSEGIDIKSVSSIVLFSSARSRLETIQRIGRCLRVDPANPGKRSSVVDFVRTPDGESDDDTADQERAAWLSALSDVEPEGGQIGR